MGQGAPAAKSGRLASCAEPAYTNNDMPMACAVESPDCTIATPVTAPQIAMAMAAGKVSCIPCTAGGLRKKTTADLSADIT